MLRATTDATTVGSAVATRLGNSGMDRTESLELAGNPPLQRCGGVGDLMHSDGEGLLAAWRQGTRRRVGVGARRDKE